MSIYFMSLTISIHCFVHCLYYLCQFPLLLSLPLLSPFYTNSLFIVIMLLDFRRCVCLSFIFFSFLTKVLTMMKFKIKNIIILYKPRNYLYQHRVSLRPQEQEVCTVSSIVLRLHMMGHNMVFMLRTKFETSWRELIKH